MTADGAEPAGRKPAVTVAPMARQASTAPTARQASTAPTARQASTAPTARQASTAPGSPRRGNAAKPTAAGLGVDLATLDWQRSGTGAGSFEVAFIAATRDEEEGHHGKAPGHGRELMTARDGTAEPQADWVLLRVAGDPAGRVLVYDRTEWSCFIDGVARGEFDLPA